MKFWREGFKIHMAAGKRPTGGKELGNTWLILIAPPRFCVEKVLQTQILRATGWFRLVKRGRSL